MGSAWHETPDHRYGSAPYSFPEVPGFVVVHDHEEGWPCSTSGLTCCRYEPSLWSRFKTWLGLT